MKRKYVYTMLMAGIFALQFLFSSCSHPAEMITGEDPVQERMKTASSIYVIHDVEDMAKEPFLNTIIVAEPVTPGEYELATNGEILSGVGPVTLDLRSYGAVMSYRVLEVLKGDVSIVDTEVLVSETLFRDENGDLGKPLCAEAGEGKVVLVLHKYPEREMYYNQIPEYFLISIKENDELDVWPYLNRTQEKITLDDFRTMCKEAEEKAEAEEAE